MVKKYIRIVSFMPKASLLRCLGETRVFISVENKFGLRKATVWNAVMSWWGSDSWPLATRIWLLVKHGYITAL